MQSLKKSPTRITVLVPYLPLFQTLTFFSYHTPQNTYPIFNCLYLLEIFGIRDSQTVEILQDQAQVLLGEYVRHQYPRQPTRFGKLLLMMPSLRVITGAVLARLFFKETVGNIPVERLICDIYQTEKVQ